MRVLPPGYRWCVMCADVAVRLPHPLCRACLQSLREPERQRVVREFSLRTYHFVIGEQPRPWQRPGGSGKRYVEPETKAWQEHVAFLAKIQGVTTPLDGALACHMYFVSKVGDIDNLAKSVLDALNGLAYHDDKQVEYLAVSLSRVGSPQVSCTIENYTDPQTGILRDDIKAEENDKTPGTD